MDNRILLAALAVPLSAGSALAATQLTRGLISAGGFGAESAMHHVVSTLGQPVIGSVSGTVHTLHSGFWIPQEPDAANVSENSSLPHRFELHPGAPNPSAGPLHLSYDVPGGGGSVALRVFDVGGRRVRTLVETTESAGRHVAVWDGRDDGIRPVSPGVYFVRLEAPGFIRTRKVGVAR